MKMLLLTEWMLEEGAFEQSTPTQVECICVLRAGVRSVGPGHGSARTASLKRSCRPSDQSLVHARL